MEITVLMDNEACEGFLKEWGLSLLITYNGKNYLLDTGATDGFADNAQTLGSDLNDVDFLILSHAHFDHAGGIRKFFELNNHAKLYVANNAQDNCWSAVFERKYIGVEKGLFDEFRDRIVRIDSLKALADGAWIMPHTTPGLEREGKVQQMFVEVNGELIPDDFSHEQFLVFEEPTGLVVCSGCSHAGADVVMDEVQKAFPGQPIYALVGGLHLFNREEPDIQEFAQSLNEAGVEKVLTGHCTGAALPIFQETFERECRAFESGAVYTW